VRKTEGWNLLLRFPMRLEKGKEKKEEIREFLNFNQTREFKM
jgi:hypothetical protein